jgi:hypothetical protein
MATTPTRLTIDDFELLPYELAKNHELVDGELIDVSGNTLEHNRVAGLIFTALWLFVREHGLGMVVAEQEYAFGYQIFWPCQAVSRRSAQARSAVRARFSHRNRFRVPAVQGPGPQEGSLSQVRHRRGMDRLTRVPRSLRLLRAG